MIVGVKTKKPKPKGNRMKNFIANHPVITGAVVILAIIVGIYVWVSLVLRKDEKDAEVEDDALYEMSSAFDQVAGSSRKTSRGLMPAPSQPSTTPKDFD